MSFAGWITLATIAAAAVLLVTEWLRPDLTALLVVITLSISGVIAPEEALSGFSQSAVITILALFILSAGLEQTGVTRGIGRFLLRLTGDSERSLIAALTISAALLSLIMNTIASAAMLLPAAMGIARQTKIRPSRLLMPLSFGALLGGTATLLTTANIVTSATLDHAGLQPFALLDFLPVGTARTANRAGSTLPPARSHQRNHCQAWIRHGRTDSAPGAMGEGSGAHRGWDHTKWSTSIHGKRRHRGC
jgi:di/tricarboxylate transporter